MLGHCLKLIFFFIAALLVNEAALEVLNSKARKVERLRTQRSARCHFLQRYLGRPDLADPRNQSLFSYFGDVLEGVLEFFWSWRENRAFRWALELKRFGHLGDVLAILEHLVDHHFIHLVLGHGRC
jgi:hypothetical protein